MRKIYILTLLFTLVLIGNKDLLQAQRSEYVQQAIILNSGRFEVQPPYVDYVTVQSYNPTTHAVTIFDTIYTQSAQDVLIDGHYAYVAAQDSIIKYDIDTYQRVAAVDDSGMVKLALWNNKLIITKGFPVKRFFVEILDATNLALLARTQFISGDCGGVVTAKDTVYVSVNGGYLGTEGKLAVIDPTTWNLAREINFGANAIGIWNLYNYGGNIFSVNRTPFGSPPSGSITVYDQFGGTFVNKVFPLTVGDGLGIKDSLLYLKFNEGVGSFYLNQKLIADTTIIPDPGSANHFYILSGAVDYVNGQLYMNIGNRTIPGKCVIASTTGDSITSFQDGIATEAMSLDFRVPVGLTPAQTQKDFVTIYPNPVTNSISVLFNGIEKVSRVQMTDVTGRTIFSSGLLGNEKSLKINSSSYPSGIYILSIYTENGVKTKKVIKN
jgi:hypothetical protein